MDKRLVSLLFLGIAIANLMMTTAAQAQTTQSRVWIAEFIVTRPAAAAPFAQLPAIVHQSPINIADGLSHRSATFSDKTRYVRIVCEVQCAISGTASATGSAIVLPPARPEYFGVVSSGLISVIANP